MQETAYLDLDGTLLDSCEAILAGIEETYRQFSSLIRKKFELLSCKYSVQIY